MIYGFMHICTLNHWEDVINDQIETMVESSLLSNLDHLYLGVVGARNVTPLVYKTSIIHQSKDIKEYEWATLIPMHKFCKEHPGDHVFYIHTKGVSKPSTYHARRHKAVLDYRRFMEYKLLTQWRDCLSWLATANVVGVNWRETKWREKPIPAYFAGNFWWARTDYIASLPEITPEMTSDRAEAEFWIGRGKGIAAQVWKSRKNIYGGKYPRSDYVGKEQPVKLFDIGR